LPRNLLLEIGFIGLSDDAFGFDLPDFRECLTNAIRQEKFEFARIRCWVSQYRVGIVLEGLSCDQTTCCKEIRGPKVSAAFDYNNQALPAAKGFAAAQGLELKDLVTREVDGEKFLFAIKTVVGQSLESQIEKIAAVLLAAIPFNAAKWRQNSLFPQPPLYYTAMLDDQTLNLEVEGLKSSNLTLTHEGVCLVQHRLSGIHSFLELMNDISLMTEQSERKKIFDARVRSVLPEGYRLRFESHRMQRLCMFSESLHPVLVKFNVEFLNVIPEAIISRYLVMHTEYVPCEDAVGKLMPAVVTLSHLKKLSALEDSQRAVSLNEKLSRLAEVYRKDLENLPVRIEKLAEQAINRKIRSDEIHTPLARCANWLASRLDSPCDPDQIAILLALLQESDATEIAGNLPNTGFAMAMSCLPDFTVFKPAMPILQEMCSYFAGRIPSPQFPPALLLSLSILMCAHARLYGRMVVTPRRIFSLLQAGKIKFDIFRAFAEIFPDFELNKRQWLRQVAEEALKENQVELASENYYASTEFDPCSFYEAAREWKDVASLDIEAINSVYTRIRGKIDRIETIIDEKPDCELEAEIVRELEALDSKKYIDYAAVYEFFVKEKINIEACLLNLPAVLDEKDAAQTARISLLQRLARQLSRLPFVKKDKSLR